MTIFLEIARQCLRAEINTILDASLAADQSYVNGTLSFFGYGRNTDLSTAKRQLLGELLNQINTPFDVEKSDERCIMQLHGLITACRRQIIAKSTEHDYGDGAAEPALQGLHGLLQEIFDKLTALDLLDIPHDTDPFNGFRYYIAYYSANKIIQTYKTSGLGLLLENPQISITRTLALEKENIIVASLNNCKRLLNAVNPMRRNYQQIRSQLKLNEIRELQRANLNIYTLHGVKPGISFGLGFLGVAALPTVQAAGGSLDEALRQATAEITRTMKSRDAVARASVAIA